MALELVGGAAIGAAFGEFLSAVLKMKENAEMFKPKLEELEATLEALLPVIKDIEELNKRLNGPYSRSRGETEAIMKLMEEGKNLVCKCSKIRRWDFHKRSRYREKLGELDNKLLRFHSLHMQAYMARDLKHSLLAVNHISVKLGLQLDPRPHRGPHLVAEIKLEIKEKIRIALMIQETALQYIADRAPPALVDMSHHADDSEADDKFKSLTVNPSCNRKDQNALRISEYNDVLENGLSYGVNCRNRTLLKILRRLRGGGKDNFNSSVPSRNSIGQQYQRLSDQNALRISEYDEMNESGLCASGNDRHSSEWLALPPPLPAAELETSGGEHNSGSSNGSVKHENESQKPLHIIEATAAKLNRLSPAILMLLCCFNLFMTFLILMYK